MGYLQELQKELQKMLGDLDEAKQKEIAHFVGTKVLESYRNGQENGAAASRLARAGKGLEEAGRRLSKKQQERT
jgi:hypothetical protein